LNSGVPELSASLWNGGLWPAVATENGMKDQKLIQMTAKLYDARDTLKRLCPDKFASNISEWQVAIRDIMVRHGWTGIETMIAMMKGAKDEPWRQMWIMAAYVEMVEPSEGP
jgi:hypothetical protein